MAPPKIVKKATRRKNFFQPTPRGERPDVFLFRRFRSFREGVYFIWRLPAKVPVVLEKGEYGTSMGLALS